MATPQHSEVELFCCHLMLVSLSRSCSSPETRLLPVSISAHRAGISCRRPHKCPQPAVGLFPTSLLSSDQHTSYLALPKPAMSTQKRLVLMGESCPGLSPQHHLIKLGSEEEKPIQNTKALLTTRSTTNALSQPQIKPQANLLNCFFPD